MRFQVEESIKGSLVKGAEVRVRQESGPLPDGSIMTVSTDELSPSSSGLYLLLLSRPLYEFGASERGGAAARDASLRVTLVQPSYVIGDQVGPSKSLGTPGSSLAALRSIAATR